MKQVKELSDVELERQLEQLLNEKQSREDKFPSMLKDRDYSSLEKLVIGEFQNRISPGPHNDSDFRHWVLESVLETMFGPNIWNWYNKHC